jgi:type VI secretion system protein ImpE
MEPPMDPEQALRAGDLEAALSELTGRVRKAPADARQRVFLFQLLAVLGQWERALNQLNVAGELDAGSLAMVHTYRDAVRCEALRAEVFAGRRAPLLLGEPKDWMAWLLEAARLSAQDATPEALEQARALRERAFEAAPATAGCIEGESADGPFTERFAWIADADSRLGPMLEAMLNGGYYWIPFSRIRSLHFEAPTDLRDLVWLPAHVTWVNGGEGVLLVPSRYPGSESSPDGRIRLGRLTEWQDRGADLYTGLGQRLFSTDRSTSG